ncbi:DNA-directed RNA polymerase subunit omega [Verrucomicrobiota bacterium]
MNLTLLDQAKDRVPSIPVLINMVSKRVRQLNAGFRPYVKPESRDEDKMDIALREIAEGKLIAEIDFAASTKKTGLE